MIRHRSYLSITIHLIWSTQQRQLLITPEIEQRLYDYVAAVALRNGCSVLAIDGIENHVHLLLTLPAILRLSDLLRDIKGGSSHFIRETLTPDAYFAWQNNYAAISVSPGHRKRVIAYIHNQKAHHAMGTLQDSLEQDGETYESSTDTISQ